jgi:peptidoglycan/xylan/chitin deacetylase (PgdA/CDA1 family)
VTPASAVIDLGRRIWRRRRPSSAVLVYHRVAAADADPFGQAVRPETFERQLGLLRRFGSLVSAGDVVARLARGDSADRLLSVTFDDGYVDNLTTASPIATRLGVSVTVFVAVGPVLGGTRFWWDELAGAVLSPAMSPDDTLMVGDLSLPVGSDADRMAAIAAVHAMMRRAPAGRRESLLREVHAQLGRHHGSAPDAGRPMTREELVRLAALPGVEIGAHTVTHPSLAALTQDEQMAEMRGSRTALEQLLGRQVRLLAYPFGKDDNVSPETRELAKAAGFDAAFTTIPLPVRPETDRFAVPRLTVHEWPDHVFIDKIGALVGPPVT